LWKYFHKQNPPRFGLAAGSGFFVVVADGVPSTALPDDANAGGSAMTNDAGRGPEPTTPESARRRRLATSLFWGWAAVAAVMIFVSPLSSAMWWAVVVVLGLLGVSTIALAYRSFPKR
jgi:hypothetical protein